MKIYTRTGDDGTTGLFGGSRVSKGDPRVEAYGIIDETNASIGMARAAGPAPEIDAVLADLQRDLFTLGAELACAPGSENKLTMKLLDAGDTARLERAIDDAEAGLSPLRTFVLPGGCPSAAALHLARCVARRAERVLVRSSEIAPIRNDLLVYVNRLSDLLFTLARRANHLAGVSDVPWHGLGTKKAGG
jgi:cob(I)alamin adenosyltransferase